MHTCRLYEDCLNMLRNSVEHKVREVNFTGGRRQEKQLEKLAESFKVVRQQIDDDRELIESIMNSVKDVQWTRAKFGLKVIGQLKNAVYSRATGRIEEIKRLDGLLLARMQKIATMMMKDIYQVEIVL